MSEKYKFNNPKGIYFLTPTIVDWIDIFAGKEYCQMIIESLKFCQSNKGLVLHAYCIMPSHLHLIISSKQDENLSAILRDFKKFTSKQIIKMIWELPESRNKWLLQRFRSAGLRINRVSNFKVWQDGNQPKELITNKFIEQKLDYVHRNPVKAMIVYRPEDYVFSSAASYCGREGLIELELLE